MKTKLKIAYVSGERESLVVEHKTFSYVIEQEPTGNHFWRVAGKSMESPSVSGIAYSSLPTLLEEIARLVA